MKQTLCLGQSLGQSFKVRKGDREQKGMIVEEVRATFSLWPALLHLLALAKCQRKKDFNARKKRTKGREGEIKVSKIWTK